MRTCYILHSLALFVLFASSARSQEIAPKRAEVGGLVGWTSISGADDKTHVAFGGEAGFNAARNLQLFGEFLYNPLGSFSIASAQAKSVGGGLRLHFGGSRILAPFVVLAGGFHRESATAAGITVGVNGAYMGGGGGVSFFVGKHLVVRPEVRVERLQFASLNVASAALPTGGSNCIILTTGVFYQFGGK